MEHVQTPLLWHVPEIQVSYKRRKGVTYPKITTSKDVYDIFMSTWDMDTIELQEQFKVLFLTRANKVFAIYTLSVGGITGTVVDVRLLYGVALKAGAISIIVAHNHPSGNIEPSAQDKLITEKLVSIGKLHDIKVLDHIIITPDRHYSFADEGAL